MRHAPGDAGLFPVGISTHAPLARCDNLENLRLLEYLISTHAPLARCDLQAQVVPNDGPDFNSRTSCEVRRGERNIFSFRIRISTHAPLARCDFAIILSHLIFPFQLTHLLRGATTARRQSLGRPAISTHAPLARCDARRRSCLPGIWKNFNSRTSCEVRRLPGGALDGCISFQLTHLLRGATSGS